MIAALGNFHIGEMLRREPKPRRPIVRDVNWAAADVDNGRDAVLPA